MNTTGCPPGLATDETFIYYSAFFEELNSLISPSQPSVASCGSSLAAFDGVFATLLVIRFMFTVLVWNDWWIKRAGFLKKNNTNANQRRIWQHRIPVIPLTLTLVLLLWVMLVLLMRYNVTNAGNGGTFFMCILMFFGYVASSIIYQRRIIRLGKRIIPLSRLRLDALGTSGSEKSRFDLLATFDWALITLIVIQLLSGLVFLAFGVVGLVFPGTPLYVKLGCGISTVYTVCSTVALVYQLDRVYRCVRDSEMDPETKLTVRKKFRSQQVHFLLFVTTHFTVNMLFVVGVIPFAWYTVAFWLAVEISVSSLSAIDVLWSLCMRSKSTTNADSKVDVANVSSPYSSARSSAPVAAYQV